MRQIPSTLFSQSLGAAELRQVIVLPICRSGQSLPLRGGTWSQSGILRDQLGCLVFLPVCSTLFSLRQRGSPHPRGDALFLLPDSIRVNRRRRELGMAQPFLH